MSRQSPYVHSASTNKPGEEDELDELDNVAHFTYRLQICLC